MTTPQKRRAQVSIPVDSVNAMVARSSVVESHIKGQLAASLVTRMITPFGYILKCSGEAAVADVTFRDTEFARNMATERLHVAATPEVWAHEGWHMMKVMNTPEANVALSIANAIHNMLPVVCPHASPNDVEALIELSTRIVYTLASGDALTTDHLIEMGDLFQRADFKHDNDTLQQAAVALTGMCRGIMQGYASQFGGDLFAYWNVSKYRVQFGRSDVMMSATYKSWYPAISLLVDNVIVSLHGEPTAYSCEEVFLESAHSPYVIAQALAILLRARTEDSDDVVGLSTLRMKKLRDFLHALYPQVELHEISSMAAELSSAICDELKNVTNYGRIEAIASVLIEV